MRTLLNKIRSSEFLSPVELLKLKVSVVWTFMFIFGALTIPVSIFEDFNKVFIVLIPTAFVLMFIIGIVSLSLNRVRISMHLSIYTFMGLTLYYVAGTNQLYGYLLIYITIIIVIFYQDIYTYVFYGGIVTVYGIYYIGEFGLNLLYPNVIDLHLTDLIYQLSLFIFYIVFLINFIVSESMTERLNERYLQVDSNIKRFREIVLKYTNELDDKSNKNPVYESVEFQKAVSELAIFINEFFEHDGSAISEAVEFYFYIHRLNIEEIMQGKSSETAKMFTEEFKKFMLNQDSHLYHILFEFVCQFDSGMNSKDKRYEFQINNLLSSSTNKIIYLAFLYKYLRQEKTQQDKWGRIDRPMSHDEIIALIQSKEFREFISFEDVNFITTNQEIFEKYLY
ncbi:MAG: hypothetical protein ACLFRI_07385 [Candidatus Izemoplasmataceae bacterium]